jgi:alkaline phosphatase D
VGACRDEGFKSVVRSGESLAQPEWLHSVHVEVEGLEPERWYWYRFTAGDARSRIGRTRTAPPPGKVGGRMRFAFASCQQYEQGYFGAYRHIVADDPDLVVFLGDYIYESSWGRDHVRKHDRPDRTRSRTTGAPRALPERSGPAGRARRVPVDPHLGRHEVDNDYADDRPEDGMDRESFLLRREAAYRAYYEHMPLPPRMQPQGPRMQIYTHLDWGPLARFHVLDCRQYRSWHACPRPGRRGGSNTVDVEKCTAPRRAGPHHARTRQERWLENGLGDSRAAWNVIVQTTAMAQFDQKPGPGRAPGPTAGTATPPRASGSSTPSSPRNVANPW